MLRKSILVLFVISIAFVTSGCAQYRWHKDGASQAEFNRDLYECQTEAARTYPPHMVTQQVTSGYTTASTTNCYGSGSAYGSYGNAYGNSNVNCTTTPGTYHPGITSTSDVNSDSRIHTFRQCMYARGYQSIKVK